MSNNSGFYWVQPPSALGKDVRGYYERVEAALYAAANAWGQHIQDQARQTAMWEDRTGNARSGLFYGVDGFGMGEIIGDVSPGAKALMREVVTEQAGQNEIIITLGHTVWYGKYLELSHGGSYAVILSTIEANLPELEMLMRKAYGTA